MSCFGLGRDQDREDDRAEIRRARTQTEQLQKEMREYRRNSEAYSTAVRQQEENNRKIREELLRRDKERENERKKIQEEYQKSIEEQERLRRDIEAIRKENNERARDEKERIRQRMQEIENEKRLQEEKKRQVQLKQEEESEQRDKEKELLKTDIKNIRERVNSLIRNNDTGALSLLLKEIERQTVIIKDIIIKKSNDDIFNLCINFIAGIYEDIGDVFYANKLYDKSESLYKEIFDLGLEKHSGLYITVKYAKSLYENGKYVSMIQTIDAISYDKIKNGAERENIEDEVNIMLFNAYIKLNDLENTKKIAEKIIGNSIGSSTKLTFIINIIKEYMYYTLDHEVISLYCSLLLRYKHSVIFNEILSSDSFGSYTYKGFYSGIDLFNAGEYEKALEQFRKYPDNYLVRIYLLQTLSKLKLYNDEFSSTLSDLKQMLQSMLEVQNISGRKKFYLENEKLLLLNPESRDDYYSLYEKIVIPELAWRIHGSEYTGLFKIISEHDKEFGDLYNYSLQYKMTLADVYLFLKNNNSADADAIAKILSRKSTAVEMEGYLNQTYINEKHFDQLYENTLRKVDFINSPFYDGYYVKNLVSGQHHIMIETIRETFNESKFKEKEKFLKDDMVLGERSDSFSKINFFEIQDGKVRVVFPLYKNNFKHYCEKKNKTGQPGFYFETEIKKLIKIFQGLEDENIIINTLNPERIMIDDNDNFIIRDVFFEKSFSDGSTRSIGSSRTFKINLYRAPDEVKDRTNKTNYYILGLLLYELLYGKYIFEGVADFNTIKLLHDEKMVQKEFVIGLKDRWKNTGLNSPMIFVEKVEESRYLSKDIHAMLCRLLSADQSKRPETLSEVSSVFSSNKLILSNEIELVSEKGLIEYIAGNEDLTIIYKERNFIDRIIQNLPENCVRDLINDSSLQYVMIIRNDAIDYKILKIGSRYRIEVNTDYREKDTEEKVNIGELSDELIQKINNRLSLEGNPPEIDDFLYQTRKVLLDIKKGININEIADEFYIEAFSSVEKDQSLMRRVLKNTKDYIVYLTKII